MGVVFRVRDHRLMANRETDTEVSVLTLSRLRHLSSPTSEFRRADADEAGVVDDLVV